MKKFPIELMNRLTHFFVHYSVVKHFLMTIVLQQQFLYCFMWSAAIKFLIWTYLFFFFRLFTYQLDFSQFWPLNALPSTNLFPNFWLFLVLFRMLWMLFTVHNPCHMLHASRITTWRTIFTKRLFSVSKEWVRSWSHAFLITYNKTFTKKAFASPSGKRDEKEKKKKN